MAQITGADSARNAKIEFSTDGTTYSNLSGAASTLSITGGARATAETFTFEGDNAITTTGKAGAVDIALTFVYTEGASDAFELVRAADEAGSAAYIRWSPKGGQTGEFVFTAGPGRISNFVWPTGDAANASALMGGFTYHGPRPLKSIAA